MLKRIQIIILALLTCLFFVACSDDSEGVEYKFDREVSELKILRECADGADSGAYCFQLRYRVPYETEHLDSVYLWVDSTVVGDTAKGVSKSQLNKATAVFEFSTNAIYDTIDLTPYVKEFVETDLVDGLRDSLMVALFCGYSDDKDPGSVQRIYLHFGDDLEPGLVRITDSTWTTGAQLDWYRPSDQTDYYKPSGISGPIVGYNIVLYALDTAEDIRDVKVTVINSEGTDSTGSKIYKRHHGIRSNTNTDSVWVDSITHGDKRKNYLYIAVMDGLGLDTTDNDLNQFRMVLEGLKAESKYTIGLTAFDSAGNFSGTAGLASVDSNQMFMTTDSIAPLMPTALFTLKDTLFPEMTRLDSNNRVRIFWSRSVDPIRKTHGIKEDSVLIFPDGCGNTGCYRESLEKYIIDYYDVMNKVWVNNSSDSMGHYSKLYAISGDTLMMDPDGSFVTDTIRWVVPGDTLILRIRARDLSGYYSRALVDTILVSPGELASKVECPEGFVAVSADSSVFCMEKFEHRDADGNFVTNVLHSEAVAACEAISASGFTVGLCGESDWQKVCLSGGVLTFGVIEEEGISSSQNLYSNCNVSTNDSTMAYNISLRSSRCVNPMGVRDFPGELQEWVLGRSEDTLAVVKGGSYVVFGGLDRESIAMCTSRSFPYYTRPAYTTDTVYLYREGTRVDTVFVADTSRTPYDIKPILTQKDFKDSLQFFDVQDSNGNSIGTDYALYSEYKNGGDEWLKTISNGLKYVPDHVEAVFLTGGREAYRMAAAFYKSPSIGFRCCAYPQ